MSFLLLACFILISGLLWDLFEVVRFRAKWAPIDDDEFMRRCSPGTNRDNALKVRRIVSENMGIEYERIHPDQSFSNDLL